ncbi:hypothetical protein Tco_0810522 [Tanacetum coccineum]
MLDGGISHLEDIWKNYTRLGPIWRRNRQDYKPTPTSLKIMPSAAGDSVTKFDSIKKTRALSKEYCDSLIAQLNSKSMENANLKGQIQEKAFVTTTLQSELRRLKGKHVLDNATTKTNAPTIAPGMFKLDIEHLSHRLKNNRDAHEDYLKKTIENTNTIHGLVDLA